MGETAVAWMTEHADARIVFGKVVGLADGTRRAGPGHKERPLWRVRLPSGDVLAERAVSCLVQPCEGDSVLLAHGESSWVLAVLDSAASETRVSVPGDLDLHASGELRLQGDAAVQIAAPERLDIDAGRTSLRAGELSLLASKVVGTVLESRWVGEAATTILSRLSQHVGYAHRVVERLDHLRARQVDHAVEGAYSLKADTAAVTAEKAIKLDGAQIVIG